jgi:hypothetical protein
MSKPHALLAALAPFTVFLAGCPDGTLDQPTTLEPALTLRVRVPAYLPSTATDLGLGLASLPYCPSTRLSNDLVPPIVPWVTDLIWAPVDRTTGTMSLSAASRGDTEGFGCTRQGPPLVRFFAPYLFVTSNGMLGPDVSVWTTRDAIVAYVPEGASFTAFGPDDPPVWLPEGYSVLRRSCGSREMPSRLEVASPDEPLEDRRHRRPPGALVAPVSDRRANGRRR